MRERVQFAHMKLRAEENRIDPCALEIVGESVKFAADIRQMPLVELWYHDAAAFDANFETIQRRRGAAQAVVSVIEGVEDLRMGIVVEAVRPEKEV